MLGVCKEQGAGVRVDAERRRLVEQTPPGTGCYPLPPLNPFPLQVKHRFGSWWESVLGLRGRGRSQGVGRKGGGETGREDSWGRSTLRG